MKRFGLVLSIKQSITNEYSLFKLNDVMKKFRILLLLIATISITLQGCKDDEDPDGIVNFEQEAIDRTTDDLSPIEVNFTIDPPAPTNSEFTVSVSGAEAGTVFSTTPAIANGEVVVSVTSGATSASMTVTPIEDGIGFEDIILELELVSAGDGLTTGITTASQINIANAKDTGEPLPYLEDFTGVCGPDGTGEVPPEGWTEQVVQQNGEGSAVWGCIGEFFGEVGLQINAFVPNSQDQTSSEVWLVSPKLNLLDASAPKLNFDVDRRFPGTGDFPDPLYDIVISTDYTGLNFETATWNRFEPGFNAMAANDPGTDNMENTGNLDLSAYSGEVISVAIIYRAGPPSSFDATILRIGKFEVTE